MSLLVVTSLVTLAASLSLTALVRAIARRWDIVDQPDGRRKLHGHPVPLLGGAAVYGATVLGLLVFRLCVGGGDPQFSELALAWVVAAGFVCFVGSVDDRYDLPARLKLGLQILSVLPIIALGHYVDRVVAFGYPIELGWLGIPLTVLWLVGCINALNLIDGMDGLASIVGLSATAMMGVIAASEGHGHVAVIAMILASALVGFLVFNLPPASIFLGDSGSMVIGLSVGLLGIQGTLKTSATLAITAPAVVMTLPMFDILAAVVRRKMTGRRFDAPDRLHIHHRLLARGWNPWQVLCLIGSVCLATGAAATAATIFRRDALAWITAISLVVLMIRLRLFGYEEFALIKEAVIRGVKSLVRLPSGTQQSAGKRQLRIDAAHPRLSTPHAAKSILWDILLHDLKGWGIQQVEFCTLQNNRSRRIRWIDPRMPADTDCRWSVSVSVLGPRAELCELRVASPRPIAGEHDIAVLTSLLRTFGGELASHSELIFGPIVATDPSATVEMHRTDWQRKAA